MLGFVILFIVVFRGDLFNRNKIEMAYRVVCHSNLKKLATILQENEIDLNECDANLVNNIIRKNNFVCRSGSVVHDDEKLSLYYVENLSNGQRVITENIENHDTTHMIFTDLKYVCYYLYYDAENNEYIIDKWNSKDR